MKYLDNNLMCNTDNILQFIAEPDSAFSKVNIKIPAIVFVVKEDEITEEMNTINGEDYQTLFVPIGQIKQDILMWSNEDNGYRLENDLTDKTVIVIRQCAFKSMGVQVEFFENSLTTNSSKGQTVRQTVLNWKRIMAPFDAWKKLNN